MLSRIHLCLRVLAIAEILLTVDICLEELVSLGVKGGEGRSENSLHIFFFSPLPVWENRLNNPKS